MVLMHKWLPNNSETQWNNYAKKIIVRSQLLINNIVEMLELKKTLSVAMEVALEGTLVTKYLHL